MDEEEEVWVEERERVQDAEPQWGNAKHHVVSQRLRDRQKEIDFAEQSRQK